MTVKQRQNLLQYLNYYKGIPDGDWGPLSQEACRDFQISRNLPPDGYGDPDTDEALRYAVYNDRQDPVVTDNNVDHKENGSWWEEIEFFTPEEMKCKCGGKYCNGFPVEPVPLLVKTADKVRDHFGKASIVSSGVRCKQHNANVGGVANSRHMTGRAMDFRISGKKAAEVLEYVQSLPEVRYAYAIDSNYVHMDVK
jgi:peptidoglycan hydrolase-like protein with peptidoglycan-binding domain